MFTSSHDHMILQCYPHNNKPMDRKWIKSNVEVAPNCPRCASPNTKFCYYNNYSFLQPRYFCKGCRRYWTKGGSLRNVPVGGGCRKSRRSTNGVNNKADSPWRSGNNSYNPDLTGNHSTCNSSSSSPSTGIDSIVANDQHQQLGNKDGDIDLAAVFAKFLNQESSLEAKFLGQDLVDVSYSSTPASQLTKESQNPAASIPGFGQLLEGHWPSEVLLGEDPPQNLQLQGGGGTDREVVEIGDASGGFGIPSDGNEMVQIDAGVWTEAENLESFPWQLPMTQRQDFDSFSVDDHQLEVSAELISDVGNWSSFDLLGFEHFPTL